ncbi:MAG: P1 family peptidase [Burkholderiales bacterium]
MNSPFVSMPRVGVLAAGGRDALTDVPGVAVGHCTLDQGAIQTGVTVVRVHDGSHFLHKVPAASSVFNGFGKSVGLMQVDELGVLETPIALTNTFSVPAVAAAQIQAAIQEHPEIGRAWPTVNPLVFECNDGYLNDIQAMMIESAHYGEALAGAQSAFAQGAVGAGRGMSCFGLKGGIGSASRIAPGESGYIVGALVLSNFGRLRNLVIDGNPVGRSLASRVAGGVEPDKGSIIMLLGTNAPLDALQLRRLSGRAALGLARTGSFMGHGSGDMALAFSTAYTVPQRASDAMPALAMVHAGLLDGLFEAAVEATEQAILNSLWFAEGVCGRDGHARASLKSVW